MSEAVTITLPLSQHMLQGIGFAVVFALLAVIAFLVLPDTNRESAKGRFNSLHALKVLAMLLAPVWLWLIGHILWSLWSLSQDYNPAVQDTDLRWHILAFVGLITALGAMISAPLALIRVWTTERQTRTAEQGHMTDRISKAVEQLGAEKTVDRIGRPVTIWTGKITRTSVPSSSLEEYLSRPRSVQTDKWWDQSYNEQTDEVIESYLHTVTEWEDERTTIQWQDEEIELQETDAVGSEGSWQVFRETTPNIEVRIGGLLSLERIAQDSVRYDAGRDHVRVMEILCAYVRENAPASKAANAPVSLDCNQDSIEGKDKADLFTWAHRLNRPRADVQIALKILGARAEEQISIERKHLDRQGKGFVLDLSHTCLQGANLEGLDLSGTSFFRSRLEGSFCNDSDLSECNFIYGKLTAVSARNASFQSARLQMTDFSEAQLNNADLRDCKVSHTHFIGSQLDAARFRFPENKNGSQVNRAFFVNASFENAVFEGDPIGAVFDYRKLDIDKPFSWKGISLRQARYSSIGKIFHKELILRAFPVLWLNGTFGDGSVVIYPDDRPAHWPTEALGEDEYENEYQKWLADPANYAPPNAI